jgi:hypothetical protein
MLRSKGSRCGGRRAHAEGEKAQRGGKSARWCRAPCRYAAADAAAFLASSQRTPRREYGARYACAETAGADKRR